MTPTSGGAARRRRRLRRSCLTGFTVGAVIPLPATALALWLPAVEPLLPVLAPGVGLLRALPLPTHSWPGAVAVLVASLLNAALVALVAAVAAAAVGGHHDRSR